MDKLELKHLAPYLPYGLRYAFDNVSYWADANFTHTGDKFDLGTMSRLTAPEHTPNVVGVKWDDDKNGLYSLTELTSVYHKPILRPMSDLTKEINIGGSTFVPIIKLFRYNENAYIVNSLEQKGGLHKLEYSLDHAQSIVGTFCYNEPSYSFLHIEFSKHQRVPEQYQMFEKLFEWHFDVFGLIGSGLAIDINTLSNETAS